MTTPLRLLLANPHYLEFRGKPTVLITSGEHYGAVLNLDFDYRIYLDTLAAGGFNLTRVFSGAFRELPGSHGIVTNTLAPLPGRFVCPWLAVQGEGGAERFDLERWNPAYFARLRDFMAEASRRGIVVEYTFFCYWYNERLWKASPMNAACNVNHVGDVALREAYTDADTPLTRVQEALVRKVVTELNEFDNVYYEVANELYSFFDGLTCMEWQHRMADAIVATEAALPHRHLVAINYQNRRMRVENPHPAVSILNFHYAFPAAVDENYHLGRVVADDETGFLGRTLTPYRREAWEFFLAGGGIFNHLDYTFTCAHPDGTAAIEYETPGAGGPEWRAQLAALKRFLDGLDLPTMSPHSEMVPFPTPLDATIHVLANLGRCYALYLFGGGPRTEIGLGLPPGSYDTRWMNPADGQVLRGGRIEHPGGVWQTRTPFFSEDLALRVTRRP